MHGRRSQIFCAMSLSLAILWQAAAVEAAPAVAPVKHGSGKAAAKSVFCKSTQNQTSTALTGRPCPGMSAFEKKFGVFLKRWNVPGASLAVARKGRLVYARGFGWADRDAHKVVEPTSLFRIASISKSLTATAALKLVQDGKLALTDRAFDILSPIESCGAVKDKRIYDVTIADLLYCTGGWSDKDKGDPLFMPVLAEASTACGSKFPPDLNTIIRYWMTKPLHFAPGTSWGYSNFEYSLLGEIIAKKSGMPYEQYVRENILIPSGINDMVVGKTVLKFDPEVMYYAYPGQPLVSSIFEDQKQPVYWQYGGSGEIETVAASAGWIASSVDLVKLAGVLSGECTEASPLSQESLKRMLTRSPSPFWNGKKGYFAMGWEVYPAGTGSGFTFSRVGTMPGTMSFLVHRYDGTCWSVLFNCRPENANAFMSEAKAMIWETVNQQKQWPPGEPL